MHKQLIYSQSTYETKLHFVGKTKLQKPVREGNFQVNLTQNRLMSFKLVVEVNKINSS